MSRVTEPLEPPPVNPAPALTPVIVPPPPLPVEMGVPLMRNPVALISPLTSSLKAGLVVPMPTLPPARTTTLKLVGSSVALTSPKFPAPPVFVEPVLKSRQFLPPVSVFSKNMDVPFVEDVERCSFPLGLVVPMPTLPANVMAILVDQRSAPMAVSKPT